MTLRAWLIVGCTCAVLAGCADDPTAPPAPVSTGGDGDGDGDGDASSDEAGALDAAALDAELDAGEDAANLAPSAPATDGVHLSIGGAPYETTREAFVFGSTRPGVQGNFVAATLRVELTDTPGTLDCRDGATLTYEVADGQLAANRELGSCTVVVEAFGSASGDPIVATFEGTLERTNGEVADAIDVAGRIQVGHP